MKHVAGTSGLRAKVKAFALLVLSKKRGVDSAASVPEIAPASANGANGVPALGQESASLEPKRVRLVGTVASKLGNVLMLAPGVSTASALVKANAALATLLPSRVVIVAKDQGLALRRADGVTGVPALDQGYAVQTQPPSKAVGTVELPL